MTDRRRLATDVVRRLRAAGHEAYFAGGCVRDRLLGREPLDYDVATSAPPEAVQAPLPPHGAGRACSSASSWSSSAAAGSRSRRSAPTTPTSTAAARAAVHFGSAREDAARRDFTINALFEDPAHAARSSTSSAASPTCAPASSARSATPRARIAEDRLRMLRAVRFAARLGFRIDPATHAAIVAAAPTLPDMAAERIGDEIVKILTEGGARRGFELLDDDRAAAPSSCPRSRACAASRSRRTTIPRATSGRTRCCCWTSCRPARPRRSRSAPCCTTSPSRCAPGGKGDRITFYGHPDASARTWRSRSASACGAAARPGSASTTWCGTTSASCRRRRCGSPRSRRCSRRTASTSSAVSRASTPSRRAATSVRALLRAPEGRAGGEALRPPRLLGGADLLAMGYPPGPTVGRDPARARRRAARGRDRDACRRRGVRPRALSRAKPETSQARGAAGTRPAAGRRSRWRRAGPAAAPCRRRPGPAMSRWAQGTPSTNSPRKSAPMIVLASPPTFFRSAMRALQVVAILAHQRELPQPLRRRPAARRAARRPAPGRCRARRRRARRARCAPRRSAWRGR